MGGINEVYSLSLYIDIRSIADVLITIFIGIIIPYIIIHVYFILFLYYLYISFYSLFSLFMKALDLEAENR